MYRVGQKTGLFQRYAHGQTDRYSNGGQSTLISVFTLRMVYCECVIISSDTQLSVAACLKVVTGRGKQHGAGPRLFTAARRHHHRHSAGRLPHIAP